MVIEIGALHRARCRFPGGNGGEETTGHGAQGEEHGQNTQEAVVCPEQDRGNSPTQLSSLHFRCPHDQKVAMDTIKKPFSSRALAVD